MIKRLALQLTWRAVAKAEVPLPSGPGGLVMVPEVMRRPKPSWCANAYPDRMLGLRTQGKNKEIQ